MFDKMVIVANSEESPAQIALDKDVYWQAVIEGPDYDPTTKSAKGTNWDIVQSKKTAYNCEDYQKNAVIYDLFTSWERQYKGICDAQWQMIDNDTYNMEPWGFLICGLLSGLLIEVQVISVRCLLQFIQNSIRQETSLCSQSSNP